MNIKQQRLAYLFERLVNDDMVNEERVEFMQLVNDPVNGEFIKSLIDEIDDKELIHQPDIFRSKQILADILAAKNQKPATVRSLKWWSSVAAAVIVIAFTSWFIFKTGSQPAFIVQAKPSFNNDVVAPSSSRALLKLSNGKEIYLDEAVAGTLAKEGNASISKTADGDIIYDGNASADAAYNTLELPRGAKPISVNLSDNSKVWLNAGSSITFPVAFGKKKREVNIDGEVYFEIKKDASRPFIVNGRNDTQIEVLGTSFNVNSYNDEPSINITLFDGSVKVKKSSAKTILKPGEQAIVTDNISISNNIDIGEIMAWKNGVFQFEATGIEAIMRQLSRAYNISYEIKGKINETFGGSISRNVNLSQVLTMLELTKVVNFEIEGTKIIVRPG